MLQRLLYVASTVALSAISASAVDFQREVRPILSDNCFHCHGPDANTRMAGLRLDLKEAAMEQRRRGAAVVPGKPDESLLYQRIAAENPARRMPPESSHKKLSTAQVALLKRWIAEGADWKEHWSLKAPVAPKLPTVTHAAWVKNPIDRFIVAKLEEKGLAPAAPADRRTLIRRVALDLTGLPPKPLEVDQFLKDPAPDAYERMIDRYLASPHYGEHRGRFWLDAARYGDTHGIHIDNYREMWPYRDWVIQAFNRNMPFDQFSTEQLAGDLLPNATMDQKIATGFQRCNVTTSEGGAIDDEYYEIYAKDRADTAGAVWLGLTVGCATCHDHKFDPISQKDFYALGAFFRNTPQKAMDGNVADTPPVMLVPREEDREDWERVQKDVLTAREKLRGVRATPEAGQAFAKWLAARKPDAAARPLGDAELFSGVPAGSQHLRFVTDNDSKPVKTDLRLDAGKPFAMTASFLLPDPKKPRGYVIASQQNAMSRGRGWSLEVARGIALFRMINEDGRSLEVRAIDESALRPGAWNHMAVTYDGTRNQKGLTLYVNGIQALTQGFTSEVSGFGGNIENREPVMLGRSFAGGLLSDFRIFDRVLTEPEVAMLREWPAIRLALATPNAELTGEDRGALLSWFLHSEHAPYRQAAEQLAGVNAKAAKIRRRGAITHVMYELPQQATAHTLFRGAYDQKRDLVVAHVPSVLPQLKPGQPNNRLGFAEWLFTKENPLTARVTVNRMWQEIFGVGLVKTADDFGSQGEPPSHPELLDWLAIDFRDNGWDIKRFYKQVLMSSTYRQAALATPAKLAKDPDNRLLSRGPRFRMDAEMVRDYALAASGLLSRAIGGPSVRPYQPEGIWEAVAMDGSNTRFYKKDSGEGVYRRSMYTFWKRSAPPASMEIFNAPSRESCTIRRERTNTPLQALVTMNDVQFVEAARILAEHALQNLPAKQQRIDQVAHNILLRPLTPQEEVIVNRAYSDYLKFYDSHPDDAKKLLRTGDKAPDPSLPRAEYAALTMVANQLLNLDEVLNK